MGVTGQVHSPEHEVVIVVCLLIRSELVHHDQSIVSQGLHSNIPLPANFCKASWEVLCGFKHAWCWWGGGFQTQKLLFENS